MSGPVLVEVRGGLGLSQMRDVLALVQKVRVDVLNCGDWDAYKSDTASFRAAWRKANPGGIILGVSHSFGARRQILESLDGYFFIDPVDDRPGQHSCPLLDASVPYVWIQRRLKGIAGWWDRLWQFFGAARVMDIPNGGEPLPMDISHNDLPHHEDVLHLLFEFVGTFAGFDVA